MRKSTNRRGSSPLRPLDWIGAQYGGLNLAALQTVCDWLITPAELAEAFTNPTLMASRVVANAKMVGGPESDLIGGFGFGLIEWMQPIRPGFFGVPDCPDVFRDQDLDWILRQVFMVASEIQTGTILSLNLDEQYASKARRRLETGSGILMVASNSADVGTNLYNWSVDARCLIKE